MAKRRTITPIYPYDPLVEYRDKRPEKSQPKVNKSNGKTDRLLFFTLCLALVTTICTFAFFGVIFTHMTDLTASRKEHTALLELAESINSSALYVSAFDAEMRGINPDYICWIKIEGTDIDYPVVRGSNNEKYLNLSFHGEENMYGSLFMDYRGTGEYVPNIIIYGHNTKTGDMFGGLRNYLDEQYLAEHPLISIKINDRIIEYEIFAARKTDVTDPAYYLDFNNQGAFLAFVKRCGAPVDSTQIITLSTCVSGDDKDERVIVQGSLR